VWARETSRARGGVHQPGMTAAAAAEPPVRVDNSDSLDDSGDLVAPSFASIFRVWANLRTRTWCGRGAGPTPMWQSAGCPAKFLLFAACTACLAVAGPTPHQVDRQPAFPT
jgi:hypothetical protein